MHHRLFALSFCVLGLGLGFAAPLLAQSPDVTFDLSDATTVAGADAQLTVSVINDAGNITGFSFSACSDPTLIEPYDFFLHPTLTTLNGGSGPDQFSAFTLPEGLACGLIIDFFGIESLPIGPEVPLITVIYETFPTTEASAEVSFCDTVGSPPVATIVVVGSATVIPTQSGGTIEFVDGVSFARGDPNQDGSLNIADAITVLNYLFANGPGLCLISMDANGDNTVDIADALHVFSYLNGLGPAPLAPFPMCGVDNTGSTLTCDSPPSCL